MKILYYCKDYDIPMYQWQYTQIIDEMLHYNCEIEIFSPLKFCNPAEANEKLIKFIYKSDYDLFMTAHGSDDIYPETIKSIKKLDIPTLLICFDNLIVPQMHLKIAPYFDLVWLTSIETKYLFDKKGCNTIFLPYAANPFLERLREESVRGIGFVGTPYGSRANVINMLTKNRMNIYCHCLKQEIQQKRIYQYDNMRKKTKFMSAFEMSTFHEGRKILKGYVSNKLKKENSIIDNEFFHKEKVVHPRNVYLAYGKYSLNLSVNSAANTDVLKEPLNVLNLRCFEIPMSGGIEFCKYVPELADYFEDGKEIVMFRDEYEMIDKAKYYLSDKQDSIRKKIRLNARKRAENEHTWNNRFSKVFSKLGINE